MSVNRQKGASRFGQRRPPLTELIRNILERYPDGGQILKELIQNADDAGATEVNFLYDNRCHGTEFLETPELANFQGPALYCHNNATFKEDDWEGIQNLMRSNKKDDPLKVGQFGIGFNSVYHITDLPGIVSGTTVGFLDPHETHFIDEDGRRGVSGKRYFFDENLPDHISRDQFLPFQGIFDCNIDAKESYDGTLFRFPLRTVPSKLSKKNYTKEMVDNLFGSLRDESSVILLFLKSVLSISVHERNQDGEMECVFKVEVAEDTREEVRRKRQEFLNKAKEPTITESRYIMSIQITFGSHAQRFRWLIVNQVGSNEERISELANELCLLPWIGMAVALDENNNSSSGRIFCFLPLPSDVDCQTGLPIHVHGYFGLTDNRRGLVWPGADCQNTATAEWNELLLKKIAVEVYCKILKVLVQDVPCTGNGKEQRNQLVYGRWPVLANVQGHWKIILDPLFRKLMQENQKLFYAQHKPGNSWITLGEGILDRLKESGIASETREAILKILLNSFKVVITNVPSNVLEIMEKFFPPPQIITPALLRSVLKSHDVSTTSREDKVLLLDFVLRDDPTTDLKGIPLLPLANKQFTKFSRHNHARSPSTSIFVPTSSCPATLLPNMSHRFLDENLPEAVGKKLVAMATNDVHSNNSTQLVRVTKEIVLNNFRSCLPSEWSNNHEKVQWIPGYSDHPPKSWLREIWHWIHSSFPNTLSPFANVPLIDLQPQPTAATHKSLGVLSQYSKFIFAGDDSCNVLPRQVINLLTSAGCTVLSNPPSYLRHPDINSYIAPPTPAGATSVLSRASLQTVQQHIKLSTSDDRGILREFFSRLPESRSTDKRNFLLQLPLFDTLHGSCTAVQVNGRILNAASPEFCLPRGFILRKSKQIISSADPKAHQLLTMLNVEILKPAAVFVRYLFPDIQSKYVYNLQETSTIMLWILRQMFNYNAQFEGFYEKMKDLPFVSTDEVELKKPSELYDPNDVLLSNLFLGGKNKFPSQDFADRQVIPALKELGLRTRSMLTVGDLLGVAVSITSSLCSSSSIHKVQALVEILKDKHAGYLNQHIDRHASLKDKLLQLKWLPCAKTPPNGIPLPDSMPWFNSVTLFFAPAELRSKSRAVLVGSSMPILGIEMDELLQKELGLTSDPPVHRVVAQLKTAVQVWKQQDHRKATSQFQEMLIAIYIYLSKKSKKSVSIAINDAFLKQWIWHGTGFCSPTQVALEKDFALDLRPQLFLLPEELNDTDSLAEFFLQHSVRQTFSEDDITSVLVAIRDKHASSSPEAITPKEIERDLKLCRSILEWMVKDGETLKECLQEKIFVPVQNDKNTLVLEPCKKCTYYDREWLRGESDLITPEDYTLIHDSITAKVATLLGVPALSMSLMCAKPLSFNFEQTGPHEPLTTRLSNILKEYKEGVGVFKELIQNADDAGASKVRFLVDWRHGPKEKLLSPGMVDCQGPALWAYNDAVFTDKDFENINKLAGATKVDDYAKIGRFGLGFNAVYHLTDVPSFVSREHMVIFDPNLNHLDFIKDKSHPGIHINLSTDPIPLRAFADQFQPYHNIFNCTTQGRKSEKFYYDGTLFRFPFRTLLQKEKSKISQSVYDEDKVKELVHSLKESAPLLLLYTQRVDQVELYVVNRDDSPEDMELQLSVTKDTPHILRSENTLSETFIEECSKWWQRKLVSSDSLAVSPSCLELVAIKIRDNICSLPGNTRTPEKRELWLVTSCVGTDSSVELASHEGRKQGMLPYAGAAVKLSNAIDSGQDDLLSYYPESVQGEAFCFLPLSLPTGLPVHLNGYFAITSNRRGIWERDTLGCCQPIEVRWNECLMKDALSNAYIQLLEDMKNLCVNGKLERYNFAMLWPCYESLCSAKWETLVKSFYEKLVERALFWSDGEWLSIHEGNILDEQLQNVAEVAEILKYLEWNVFQLPPKVCTSLEKSGHGSILTKQTLTLEKFLQKVFRPNITRIPPKLRDAIVCFGLDCTLSGELELFFEDISCIVCSSDGHHLAKPSQLINPKGAAAALFSEEDCRFPIGAHFLTQSRAFALEQLGMAKDLLSWDDICDRARSVETLSDFEKKRERARKLVKYLDETIEKLTKNEEAIKILRNTKFLPIMSESPHGYFLPWKGSEHKEQLGAPGNLFLPRDKELVGSSCLIMDNSNESLCGCYLGPKVEDLLGFSQRRPVIEHVIQQLDTVIRVWSELSAGQTDEQQQSVVESVCKRVYEYFENFVYESERQRPQSSKQQGELDLEQFLTLLNQKEWIFILGRFLSIEKVAEVWKGNGAPFLYRLPDEYSWQYKNLWSAVGVKNSFDEIDFINSLYALQDSKKSFPLSEEELKLAACFLHELKDVKETTTQHVGEIPLPDTNQILHRGDILTINQTFWLTGPEDTRYVHPDIPQQLALDLGARTLQNRFLKKYSETVGTSFGQQEKLTDRLKSILQNYPCDSGILKELIQNADDAEASEIHFIYDTRVLPCEQVFQKHAKEIQGPALCVYNDRPFTEEDLKGITKLGIGSKGDHPEKTGQYGIGFNAVYHLTDCPSFLSNNDTLVLLDPRCRYAPEATQDSPGEQFRPIDEEFRGNFPDVFLGYLGEHFNLEGTTMFRLPLRTSEGTSEQLSEGSAPIAEPFSKEEMEELLQAFENEAKKTLLFLNHIKKITLSKIGENNMLQQIYVVNSILSEKHDKQRRGISATVKAFKKTPTREIPWESQMYPMAVSDCKGVTEHWLVHQCCGTQPQSRSEDDTIPDGHRCGLFPRGGIAALLSSPLASVDKEQPPNVAYCGLPLPVQIPLPVIVNGHFALGSSRRGIWRDTEPNRKLTKWNDFIKSRVIAPAYAAIICEARHYIPHYKISQNQCYFTDSKTAKIGLDWYHNLFPDVSTDSEWKILAIEVYRCLWTTKAKVLPEVVDHEYTKQRQQQQQQQQTSAAKSRRNFHSAKKQETLVLEIRRWLSADEGFFIDEIFINEKSMLEKQPKKLEDSKKPEKESKWEKESNNLKKLYNILLRINLPLLLHTPMKVHDGFKNAEVKCRLTCPLNVIEFLRKFHDKKAICDIGQLPTMLEHSKIGDISELRKVIKYCKKEDDFLSLLEGLPLLLTADGQLRVFDSKNPVYYSKFSDLFPRQTHWFVHPELVSTYPFRKMTQSDKEEECAPQVMRSFTLEELVRFMPDILPPNLKGVAGYVAWSPDIHLSKERLTRLWEYLQNYADPEPGAEPERLLEPLSEWPIIPTMCGKLVSVSNANTVFDMTETGTETERGVKIREHLRKLKCPCLDKDITCGKWKEASNHNEDTDDIADKAATASTKLLCREAVVTDPYVAHPHKVADILQVLHYMRKMKILNVSVLSTDEVREILEFFQDEFDNLEEESEELLKGLPLHETIHSDHVSLSTFSSSAIVPPGVPLEGIKKLQSHIGCVFLHWNASQNLIRLYKRLGTRPNNDISRFYMDFILPYFSIFCKESQMKYLKHMKDELPISREKRKFSTTLRQTRCVPNQEGSLSYAEELFDPRDKVFKIMLLPNKFPPPPFDDHEWLDFFIEFGLHKNVEKNNRLFFQFCKDVANQSLQDQKYEMNVRRSKVLVNRLLRNSKFAKENLQKPSFLNELAAIKFIASEKVPSELSSIHKQYQCVNEDRPPFISYLDSIPWSCQNIVWTSAHLLPKWAQSEKLERYLRISKEPTVDTVVNHMENICNSLTEVTKNGPLPNPDKIQEIMNSIYSFLSENIKCPNREVSDNCTETCRDIGRRFNHRPCVYVDETLIKGEQLSFALPGKNLLNPFLYTISRDYCGFEHLFKRLGATEKVTSLQLANLLKAMKGRFENEKMDENYEKKACFATIQLLKRVYRESCHGKEASKISDQAEIFLPSDDKCLVKSNELVSEVPLRLLPVMSKKNRHVLFPLEKYNLPRGCTEKYLAALPEHLRPVPWDSFVRETLDPSCRNNTCKRCSGDSVCSFIAKYTNILQSTHFQEGVARLLLHQKKSNKLAKEEIERSSRFLDEVDIKCMESINTYLIDMQTQMPLEEDYSRERPGYVDRHNDQLTLYIIHETKSLGFLTTVVNEVMDSCIEDKYIPQLTDMLQCDSPSEIPKYLTDQDITLFSSEGNFLSDESEDELDEAEGASAFSSNLSEARGEYSRIPEACYEIPADRREAYRWMKQSLSDLDTAKFMLTADPPSNALACFHSHEAVEKSLKAALYANDGIDSEQLRSHRVDLLANDVQNQMKTSSHLSTLAENVKDYYVPPRYPNAHRQYIVPVEAYGQEQARQAIENANELLEIVKTLIDW